MERHKKERGAQGCSRSVGVGWRHGAGRGSNWVCLGGVPGSEAEGRKERGG